MKYLVKNPALVKARFKHKLYETAAKIFIKYGPVDIKSQDDIGKYLAEFWNYDPYPPTVTAYQSHVQCKVVKSHIEKYLKVGHPIWNSDFIHGLCSYGEIRYHKHHFASAYWYYNKQISHILKKSPFGGKLSYHPIRNQHAWCRVPALSLKHQKDTIAYMAGVFATGQVHKHQGKTYIKYNSKVGKLLKEWGIPIEYESASGIRVLIAPIWPSLFVKLMPAGIGDIYINIKGEVSNLYAAILFYTYISTYFRTDGIPYLQSRRTIFYKYKHPDGALYRLEMMRVEKNLVDIDPRIKEAVKSWATG